jgi:ATP-dependent Clp protease, protease subunit
MRPCFAFSPAVDTKPAVLSVFEEIGFWGVQAKDFMEQLSAINGDSIRVEINSPGGDVFAALAMYNALRASGKQVTTAVMGVAASAASVLMLAGDTREMPNNTFVMVHSPMSGMYGTAQELRDTADMVDKIGNGLIDTYVARTGLERDKVVEMLSKDTWISAQEALDMGFATKVTDAVEVTAKYDVTRAELPDPIRAALKKQPEPTSQATQTAKPFADEVFALASAAGFEAFAPLWVVQHADVAAVQAAIGVAAEIKALCAVAKKPEVADKLIASGKSLVDARATLVDVVASYDTHIDTAPKNSNSPSNGAGTTVTPVADIYAMRRPSDMK